MLAANPSRWPRQLHSFAPPANLSYPRSLSSAIMTRVRNIVKITAKPGMAKDLLAVVTKLAEATKKNEPGTSYFKKLLNWFSADVDFGHPGLAVH